MNPKDRNLSKGMEGEDVGLLQKSLRILGFTIKDKDGYFGDSTQQAVIEFQKTHNLKPTGVVDSRTAAAIRKALADIQPKPDPRKRYSVQGKLLQPDGTPVAGAVIKAFDKDLRTEKLLGETKTDSKGKYVIRYTIDKLCRPDKRRADLIVRAYDEGKEIATSPLIIGAASKQVVDLVVSDTSYRCPSEYSRLCTLLDPLLQDIDVTALNEEDVAYLAGKTGLDPTHVAYFVQSQKLAKVSDTAEESGISPEAFYGLFRQGLPTSLPVLLTHEASMLRKALLTAIKENIISKAFEKEIYHTIVKFQKLIVYIAFKEPEVPKQSSLGDLLSITGLPEEDQRDFLHKYLEHRGPIEDFWQDLREDEKFSDTVEDLQFTLQLGTLTQNHVPLIKALHQNHNPSSLRDLVNLDQGDWEELINLKIDNELVDVPSTVEGETRAERINNYVRTMMRMVEDAFPTPVIVHNMNDDVPNQAGLSQFFSQNPDFEFRTMRVDSYLAENEGALDNIENAQEVKKQVRGMQRLFNIAPRFERHDAIYPLMAENVTSAYAIRRMGRTAFYREYGEQLGSEQAAQIYANASHTTAVAQMLIVQHGSVMNGPEIKVLPNFYTALWWEEPEEGIPDWETLFGSLDICECEHCRSVYSPAAYLVDILHFLKNCGALYTLFKRRGDIGDIELTCKNTNTVMPYVDLINEILENAVAPATVPTDNKYQTEGTEEELRVYPEHLNRKAYETLVGNVITQIKDVIYPWTLPFDLWAEEARMYLGHLGVPRYELMEGFQDVKKEIPSSLDIADEHLRLTQLEREIITGERIVRGGATIQVSVEPHEFWGMGPVNWVNQLSTVSKLLEKSGLCYKELRKLLQVDFINPNNDMHIIPSPTCNLDEEVIENLSDTKLDHIHRFVRLQRKLNWSIHELDAALRALQPRDLTEKFLVNLSHVLHLHDTLKVPLIEMFSWWSNIDTVSFNDEPSLYEELFLNKTVMNPPDPAFELQDEITSTIGAHESTILAALRINADDLALLAGEETPLSLTNLSALYRVVSLAKALKLSISNFLSLQALSGINPFNTNEIEDTIRFVEAGERVRASGFSIDELNYLLRHHYQPNSVIVPSEEQVGLILGELRSGLQKIAQEYQSTADPAGEQIAQALAILLSEEDAEEALAIVDGSSTGKEKNDEKDKQKKDKQKKFVNKHFAGFLDPTDAMQKLVYNDIPRENKEERFNYVVRPLLTYLQQGALVKQKMADALNLTMEAADLLLSELVPSRDSKTKAIDDFLNQPTIEDEEDFPATQEFNTQFTQFLFLHKIAIIITRFDIPSEELRWLFQNGTGLGLLDLTKLPLDEKEDGVKLFKAWLRMAEMANLRDELPPGEPTLFSLMKMLLEATMTEDVKKAEDEFIKALSERTGWHVVDLEFLMGAEAFDLSFPGDFQNEKALEQLIRFKRCFDLIKVLGASANKIWGWIIPNVGFDQAQSIRKAVKAKYEKEQWLAVAKPLRDELREQQRAALVAYNVHKMRDEGIQDANDLFGYFLIDVEMSACMMTSRIKQAISSVQLFVNRCLMNLEPEVKLTPEDVKDWDWMKNYRVWEANRKVFLYPENWIEPELRDNKSPFFVDLENELLQNEVTMDTVEQSFLNYLEKLAEVARLEMCGMYYQENDGILHVFGRTRGTPHIYYYRRWIDEKYWTPWERVDVDIEGDHLIPVVYNRRLHLFWPVFRENAVEEEIDKDDPKPPKKYYKIYMAWSEYKNGKWSPKQVSDEFIQTRPDVYLPPKIFFRFCAFAHERDLVIAPEIRDSEGFTEEELEQFKFIGCDGLIMKVRYNCPGLHPIPSTVSIFMSFVEEMEDMPFILPISMPPSGAYLDPNIRSATVLKKTPGTFSVLLPHQYRPFYSQAPFFYEDHRRTFFVVPRDVYVTHLTADQWCDSNKASPEYFVIIPEYYNNLSAGQIGPITGPDSNLTDYAASMGDNPVIGSGGSKGINAFTSPGTQGFSNRIGGIRVDVDGGSDIIRDPFPGPKKQLEKRFRFDNFYHPYVGILIEQLNRYGIDGLLNPDPNGEEPLLRRQLREHEFFVGEFDEYDPTFSVIRSYPKDQFDFSYSGAYSLYNWELFFHTPFLIANCLSNNQRFSEAQKWYHYIFDPTDVSSDSYPKGYWKIKPFYRNDIDEAIQRVICLLRNEGSVNEELRDQITEWTKNPFNPHAIAQIRVVAYQKAIVMKYIDNLIAWGDHLFRRDTIESINEATQLYVLAAQILGDRPQEIPPPEGKATSVSGMDIETFTDLEPYLDELSSLLINIETNLSSSGVRSDFHVDAPSPLVIGPTLFFCIPRNDKLLSYWDTVADRLFKIRYCMTIEGVVRQLPLFQPPIEPSLLVRAAAAGVDIGSALNDLYAPLPYYRFQFMLQKAVELCAEVKSLGAALLAALEKRDAEGLALLRSSHELNLLNAVRQIKEKQIEEIKETLDSLDQTLALAQLRTEHYMELLGLETEPEPGEIPQVDKLNLIPEEQVQLNMLGSAKSNQETAMSFEILAQVHSLYPDVTLGSSGMSSPVVTAQIGGSLFAGIERAAAAYFNIQSARDSSEGNLASIMAGHIRVAQGWALQLALAVLEKVQIGRQIAAADIRLDIAELDLKNHDLQIENAKEVDEYMRNKFTNQQLYNWMVSQISTIYFQSYQMAYDLAKRAEKAFQHEIGDPEATFIQFGYWDSLKKGLLAGEKLHYDLKRMEVAYYEQNKREYEITQHISLAMLHPEALVKLKETGECFFNLPEAIFDLNYPGHYKRRIKSVSLTIPCVTGPYTNVSCTLSLLSNRIRQNTRLTGNKYAWIDINDERFTYNVGGIQSIATSNAREDSGLFELNFRDERYLPFEGAGAISTWCLKLPTKFKQFDYDTISDVIIHLRYTAKEGGEKFRMDVEGELKAELDQMIVQEIEGDRKGIFHLFSAKREFPNKWHQFLHPKSGEPSKMELDLAKERFPFQFKDKDFVIDKITLFVKLKNPISGTDSLTLGILAPKETGDGTMVIYPKPDDAPDGVYFTIFPSTQRNILQATPYDSLTDFGVWTVKVVNTNLDPGSIDDISILCHLSFPEQKTT